LPKVKVDMESLLRFHQPYKFTVSSIAYTNMYVKLKSKVAKPRPGGG